MDDQRRIYKHLVPLYHEHAIPVTKKKSSDNFPNPVLSGLLGLMSGWQTIFHLWYLFGSWGPPSKNFPWVSGGGACMLPSVVADLCTSVGGFLYALKLDKQQSITTLVSNFFHMLLHLFEVFCFFSPNKSNSAVLAYFQDLRFTTELLAHQRAPKPLLKALVAVAVVVWEVYVHFAIFRMALRRVIPDWKKHKGKVISGLVLQWVLATVISRQRWANQ
eukprot:TRINITY_DN68106_c4_g1_i1.p1 TRINITY_DN68106_c4_g1~~TRINITY_DN68106_c4_g1_i1.p1  ORF type:complete len:227 (-),score=21.22 TRINITY_DN68106_c4_g1_i1:498-1151(-)